MVFTWAISPSLGTKGNEMDKTQIAGVFIIAMLLFAVLIKLGLIAIAVWAVYTLVMAVAA